MAKLSNMSDKQIKKLKDDFSVKVGKRIKSEREKKKITQEELAELAGFYRTYIGHIESGTYSPSLFTVWRIANSLQVDISVLVKGL